MKASKVNIKLKILSSIFAIVNLALISGGLVSCGLEARNPLAPTEQEKPRQQPNQDDNDDDKDDNTNDDDKDDDDKD
ncbi:hypothetical protein A6S26_09665 [Nostoc sp. ATCC 43529]|nr:hypothetical protein A6S26_09665 [Nostoc sp. ATCC 43529]